MAMHGTRSVPEVARSHPDAPPGDENKNITNVMSEHCQVGSQKISKHHTRDQVEHEHPATSPRKKQLEPSLQAWAASKPGPRTGPLTTNVGASESAMQIRAEPRPSRSSCRASSKQQSRSEKIEEHDTFVRRGADSASDSDDHEWLQSLRQSDHAADSQTRGRTWRPQMTLPKEPHLKQPFAPVRGPRILRAPTLRKAPQSGAQRCLGDMSSLGMRRR